MLEAASPLSRVDERAVQGSDHTIPENLHYLMEARGLCRDIVASLAD